MRYYVEAVITPTTKQEELLIMNANIKITGISHAIKTIEYVENCDAVELLEDEIIKLHNELKEAFGIVDKMIMINEEGNINIFDRPSGGIFDAKIDKEGNMYIEDDKPERSKEPEFTLKIKSDTTGLFMGKVNSSLTGKEVFGFVATGEDKYAILDMIRKANGDVI